MGELIKKCYLYLISSVEFGLNVADQTKSPVQSAEGHRVPSGKAVNEFSIWDELLTNYEIACVLQQLPLEGSTQDITDKVLHRRVLENLCSHVQSKNVAFLLENNFRLAAEIGADGVHITLPWSTDKEIVKQARYVIGQSAILGLTVDGTRHHAMTAGELDVSYLSFDKVEENAPNGGSFDLLSWWNSLFEIPTVAWNLEHSQDVDLALSAGAEFIAITAPYSARSKALDLDISAVSQILRDNVRT